MFDKHFLSVVAWTFAVGFYKSCEKSGQWPSDPEIGEVATLFDAFLREMIRKRQHANMGE